MKKIRANLKRTLARAAVLTFVLMTFAGAMGLQAQSQDRQAKKLADKVSLAFAYGLGKLDSGKLLNGPLKLTIENSGGEIECEYKSFRTFAAMERYLKGESHQPGFPIRSSGDKKLSCRNGLCRLDLVDNQMAHNRVFLTKIYYGSAKGRIYVKKLYIIFG
jgi:hypothetical protein